MDYLAFFIALWLFICACFLFQFLKLENNYQKESEHRWATMNEMLKREDPETWEVAKAAGAERLAKTKR